MPGGSLRSRIIEKRQQTQRRVFKGRWRIVPMNVRKDKGLPDLQVGDRVEITVNDQNLLVDVHKVGEVSHHRIVEG